jgi:RNA polymerase sigma-B factor
VVSVARGEGDIGGKAHVRRAIAPQTRRNGSSLRDAERQELVRSHLPLVRAMARRYAGRGEEVDDLVQAGSVGLVQASTRFDPSRGVAFATFVAPAVEGEIRRHLRERSPGLRLPRDVQRMSGELRRTSDALVASLGRAPEVAEVAAALDADVSEVERLMAADRARNPVPLPAAGDAETQRPGEPDAQAESEYRVLLEGGLRALDARERRIVFLRFHADMTEAQIARAVGISQAHVSRLLDGALTKLREELGERDTTKSRAISRPKAPETAASPPKIQDVGGDESREKKAGYSGRFLVRMPSELHEQLAAEAERQQVSLNRYVTHTLSSSVGLSAPDRNEPKGHDEPSKGLRPRTVRMALATNLAVVVLAGVIAVVLLVLALERGI